MVSFTIKARRVIRVTQDFILEIDTDDKNSAVEDVLTVLDEYPSATLRTKKCWLTKSTIDGLEAPIEILEVKEKEDA